MNLSELDIQEDYRSDRDNLINDFYIPCLERAAIYSRAVGFFSSSSLVAVSKGITALIKSGGKMQLVASPYLSLEDIKAIETGLKQREEVITKAILRELDREFETVIRDRLACLALWQNKTAKIEVIDFPEAATRSLLRLRPSSPPQYETERRVSRVKEKGSNYQTGKNKVKVDLRSIQVDAVEAFTKANYRGILGMATGTGKTIAALTCATRLENLDLIVIGVPTRELVNQWVEEIETKTNFRPPIVATGKSEYWREILFRKLRLIYCRELPRKRLPVIVVETYSELSKLGIADLIRAC